MTLQLHHWEPNAESLALLICLDELQLEFGSTYVDFLQLRQHSPAHLKLDAKGTLPLLDADGTIMSDSMLALQFLCDAHPEAGLAPAGPSNWYDLQAWLAWVGGWIGLNADVRLLGWNAVMRKALSADVLAAFGEEVAKLPKEKEAGWGQVWSEAEAAEEQLNLAEERVEKIVGKIEAQLEANDWIVGSAFSIVDIAAFAFTHDLPSLLPHIVNETRTPHMLEWRERIAARPSVTNALAGSRSGIAPVMYMAPGC